MNYPDWTARTGSLSEHEGRWPLGLETVGFWFAARLLPGITNTTVHVRYYSFLCWVFWTFRERLRRSGARATRDELWAWIIRLEHALRACTLHHHGAVPARRGGFGGIVGREKAVPLPADPAVRVPLTGNGAATAFDPAFYSASWEALHCGRPERDRVELTPEIGIPMGAAFHEGLLRFPEAAAALEILLGDEPSVPAGVLQTLAPGLALRRVAPEEPEHRHLVDLLFRLEFQETGEQWKTDDRSRARSLTMLLEIALQGPDGIGGAGEVHQVFSRGWYPGGGEYRPCPELRRTFEDWQRYEERQFQKVAIHGFWGEVTRWVRARELHARAIAARLGKELRGSEVLHDWIGDAALDVSVSEALHRIGARRRREEGARRCPSEELMESVRHGPDGAERLGASLVLLLLVSERWAAERDSVSPVLREAHQAYGRKRLALDVVAEDVRARGPMRLEVFARWVLEHYVLAQAAQVAMEKIGSGGALRFFIVHGDEGYRTVKFQDPSAYLGFDEPRIASGYSMLHELGLVETTDRIRCTPLGARLLERAREVFRTQDSSPTP